MIDFIGVVLEVQDLGQIQLKSTGEMRDRRTLLLGDETGNSVGATLWGEAATDRTFVPGLVIACKGAGVSDYGGKSLNISKSGTVIEYDPPEQAKTSVLQKWYKSVKAGGTQVEAITQVGGAEASIRGD